MQPLHARGIVSSKRTGPTRGTKPQLPDSETTSLQTQVPMITLKGFCFGEISSLCTDDCPRNTWNRLCELNMFTVLRHQSTWEDSFSFHISLHLHLTGKLHLGESMQWTSPFGDGKNHLVDSSMELAWFGHSHQFGHAGSCSGAAGHDRLIRHGLACDRANKSRQWPWIMVEGRLKWFNSGRIRNIPRFQDVLSQTDRFACIKHRLEAGILSCNALLLHLAPSCFQNNSGPVPSSYLADHQWHLWCASARLLEKIVTNNGSLYRGTQAVLIFVGDPFHQT